MSTAFLYDDRFLRHDTGDGHPERPDRLRAIVHRLRETGLWDRLEHPSFEPIDRAQLLRVHEQGYIARLADACFQRQHYIDVSDSAICPESFEIARLAAGAATAAVDLVVSGKVRNAFCAVRPPGHHAEFNHSMGFCLFNNVALAAERARQDHGIERVAIVDFDVHHGNGTQHTFDERADVLFISIHEHPNALYPGTGFPDERGMGDGDGHTLNIALSPHSGDAEYLRAFDEQIVPALRSFNAGLLLASAGFDAAERDPLAHQGVTTAGFAAFGQRLVDVSDGKLVALLEGGYDLDALAEGVEAFIRTLL